MKKLFEKEIILKTKNFIVSQDWEVAIPGFYIIAPKKKKKTILDFSKKEQLEYIKTVHKVREAMKKVLKINKVFFFQNEETPYRFHLWMLPHYPWMKKVTNGLEGEIILIWVYAKKHMNTEENIQKTREAVTKMRKYLSK